MKKEDILRIVIKDTTQIDDKLSLFFGDFFEFFLHKKIKRIAQAVFLVTEHLNTNDPIRDNARSLSLKINNIVTKNNKTLPVNDKQVNYTEILRDIISLFSVFEIAVVAGAVNETNYLLINKELTFLIETLNNKILGFVQKNSNISRDFFKVDLPNNLNLNRSNTKNKSVFAQKDSPFVKDNNIKDTLYEVNLSPNNEKKPDPIIDNQINDSANDKSIRLIGKFSKEQSIRDIFKNSEKMTVKDVFVLLPQYSEKTIQRELLRLVGKGILGKEGKKRWTVYFLKNTV
jgi:hypothetical protein